MRLSHAPWRTRIWEIRRHRLEVAQDRAIGAREYEITVPPGHCPNCSLEYHLARMLAGRREVSDFCALCEIEEDEGGED
jgi:hypothetical protein